MDDIDRKLLACVQRDASLPIAEMAAEVGLSPTPCWRRLQKLEERGLIRGRVALLDREKINLKVTVFVMVKTSRHNPQWLGDFAKGAAAIPEVMEVYRMSGDIDYLLRVVVPDIEAYDGVYKKLIAAAELFDVSSSFAMECIKSTTELPLRYAQ